jgi:hypothetical protein
MVPTRVVASQICLPGYRTGQPESYSRSRPFALSFSPKLHYITTMTASIYYSELTVFPTQVQALVKQTTPSAIKFGNLVLKIVNFDREQALISFLFLFTVSF